MKIKILLLFALSIPCAAADQCLVVYPMTTNISGQPMRCAMCKLHYYYAGSEGLAIAEVKDKYSKKDVEKLEKAGVKIVTIPGPENGTIKVKLSGDAAAVKEACK